VPRRAIDMTGRRIGKLTVIRRVANSPKRQACWLCKCDCGNFIESEGGILRRGKRLSCGGENHRHHSHPLYRVWANARSRCRNPNNQSWSNYGGRGITFSEKWNDFEKFVEDVGPRPSSKHTLDRIDNDGNYEPGNTRWATSKEQARNRQKKFTLTEWKFTTGEGCEISLRRTCVW